MNVVGDSRFADNQDLSGTKPYLSFSGYLGEYLYQAGIPATVCNSARSGATSLVYSSLLSAEKDIIADYTVYIIYTVNDFISGAMTKSGLETAKARALVVAEKSKKEGSAVIFMTIFPKGSGYTQTELGWIADLNIFAATLSNFVIKPIEIYGTATGGWALNPVTNASWTTVTLPSDHLCTEGYQDLAWRTVSLINS